MKSFSIVEKTFRIFLALIRSSLGIYNSIGFGFVDAMCALLQLLTVSYLLVVQIICLHAKKATVA